jgi:hypothetical protein
MIRHLDLGEIPFSRLRKLRALINSGEISLAGNSRQKIYGLLSCRSGKRLKVENRVFFSSDQEALENGYRPCGHCLGKKYKGFLGQDSNLYSDSIFTPSAKQIC